MKKITHKRGKSVELSISVEMQIEGILNNLLKIRKKRGLKQVDIANKLEISSAQYGNLESGRNQMAVRQLIKIVEVLDVPLNEILNLPCGVPNKKIRRVNKFEDELIYE